MTEQEPVPPRSATKSNGAPGAEGPAEKPEGSSWWFALLALVPIACCAGPALLAGGITLGVGAAVGGLVGALLFVGGAAGAFLALRRRQRRNCSAR